MYAYVINLARSRDRRAEVTANLDRCGIDYEIVTAIDAQDFAFTDPRVAGKVAATFYDRFRPGEAGCALSHMGVYQKILADGLEWALVLEDDIIAPPELVAIVDAVAGCMEGAEVALLNFDSEEPVQVSRIGAICLPAARQLVAPVHARQPESAAAYVITREACARMTERAFPIQTKADDWAHFIQIGSIDRLRCVVPLVVRKQPGFRSTMGYYSDSSLKARVLAMIDRLGPGLVQRMVAYRRERIWRRYTRVQFVDDPRSLPPSSRRARSPLVIRRDPRIARALLSKPSRLAGGSSARSPGIVAGPADQLATPVFVRRGRKSWRRILIVLILAFIVLSAATAWLFVGPAQGMPAQVNAIVV